jgi:hypothetical protein
LDLFATVVTVLNALAKALRMEREEGGREEKLRGERNEDKSATMGSDPDM